MSTHNKNDSLISHVSTYKLEQLMSFVETTPALFYVASSVPSSTSLVSLAGSSLASLGAAALSLGGVAYGASANKVNPSAQPPAVAPSPATSGKAELRLITLRLDSRVLLWSPRVDTARFSITASGDAPAFENKRVEGHCKCFVLLCSYNCLKKILLQYYFQFFI